MDFSQLKSKDWKPGDWIYINKLRWDAKEIENLYLCLKDDWFGGNGYWNTLFESLFAQFIGVKHFQSQNSGTAAISTALQILIQTGKLKRGDKILHPALTFPTSISAAIQYGLVPVFADTEPGTYVISAKAIKQAFERFPDIKGALIPLLLGNTPDIDLLREALNGKPLIIDSCDTVGTKWDHNEVGSLGHFGCYSFYGSHHISTAGVGGGVGTNNSDFAELLRSYSFWGRDFDTDNADIVTSFLKRYSYKTIGADSQMSALQAAFGVAQMDRLPEYIGQRWVVFNELVELFVPYSNYFEMPRRTSDKAWVSWFCFPLEVRRDAPFSRYDFVRYLTENKVETRPIMAGNILDHPPFRHILRHVSDDLTYTDRVAKNGFFIPAYGMEKDELVTYLDILRKFLEKY